MLINFKFILLKQVESLNESLLKYSKFFFKYCFKKIIIQLYFVMSIISGC